MDAVKRQRYADLIAIFMIGFLLCLLVQFKEQDNFEKIFFENITNTVLSKRLPYNEDSSIIDALHITYKLLSGRSLVFDGNTKFNSGIYNNSLTNDLLTASGACGSYAAVLANLLATMGYNTRIAQMKVNGIYGGHIITEVNTRKGWVVLDASYDLYFTTPLRRMASFDEISAHWGYYKMQAPAGYNKNYRYDGVRYANWGKIPVLLPAAKTVLTLFFGEQKMSTFSLRPLILRKYKIYYVLLIPLILLLAGQLLKNKSILKLTTMMKLLSELGLANLFRPIPLYSRTKRNYYLSFTNEVNLQMVLNCRKDNAYNTQKTATEISVFNLPFNSIFPELKAKLGLPRYHITRQHANIRHDVYFYRSHLFHKDAIAQFHYSDKRYFLCNITFVNTDQAEKKDILNTLAKKYSVNTDKDDGTITIDRKGNLLIFDNSVNLNLCYANNNSEIIRTLLGPSTTRPNAMENYRPFHYNLQEIL